MTVFFAMLIKPFLALLVYGVALGLAGRVVQRIPPGRLRNLPTRPIGWRHVHRRWD